VHKARGVDDDINAGKVRELRGLLERIENKRAGRTARGANTAGNLLQPGVVACGEVHIRPFTRQSVRH
jgi:hypothetical protein